MASYVQKLSAAAAACGLSFDSQHGCAFGKFRGYTVALTPSNSGGYWYSLMLTAARVDTAAQATEFKTLAKQHKQLKFDALRGYEINFLFSALGNEEKVTTSLGECLNLVTGYLQENGYRNVCAMCGKVGETAAKIVGGRVCLVCEDCFQSASQQVEENARQQDQVHENVVAGAVGALVGALIGAAVIVLLSQMQLVSALSGVIAAVCSVKGYELLGKKMSVKGAIICVVSILAAIYVGNRVDWSIAVAQVFEVDFFTAFRAIPLLIEDGAIERGAYIGAMLQIALFAALGAVPTIINTMRGNKVCRMSGSLEAR